jgi:two-component system NtrC family sensor kinase
MHPLLRRQLTRAFGSRVPEEVYPLLTLVDAAYRDADDDRAMYQRSLGVMSDELQARYDTIVERLQERERHFRILQAVHDGVLLLDDAGRVLEANEASVKLTGCPRSMLIGRVLTDLARGCDTCPPVDLARLGASAGRDVQDVLVTRPDERVRRCELTVAPLGEAPGAIGHWIAVLRDVTERRAMQQELLQTHKLEAIGQLAAGVAHEINTPSQYVADNLRFLADAFETVSARFMGPEASLDEDLAYLRREVPEAIHQSLSGMERIAEIVRGIKTFSHPGTGVRTPADLNAVLRTTALVSRNEWKYVAEMVLDLDPQLPAISVYADEIQHVFLNLVVNAAQAIAENHRAGESRGQIRIASRACAGGVEIRIEDDGPGVPEAIRERIFDPFFTTKPAGQGSGQGLAICLRVVEHHEGHLTLESAPRGGAAFVIRLPQGELAEAAA